MLKKNIVKGRVCFKGGIDLEEDIKIIRENDNAFKISVPLITSEEMESINNNYHNLVEEFTKQVLHDKELAMAQYIIKKQETIINKTL